jgi:amidase
VPGGSSSGSASAVAQGLCDTALGTDTGGSVRVPASFCGLYGIRPTHGRLDLTGMLPQAPSSDTTGWFARDATTFARVSEVMLGEADTRRFPRASSSPSTHSASPTPGPRRLCSRWCRALAAPDEGTSATTCSPPLVSRRGRGRSGPCSRGGVANLQPWSSATTRGCSTARRATWRAPPRFPRVSVNWAALVRSEARARMTWLLRPGDDPLHADDAVPGAAQGPAAAGAGAGARAHPGLAAHGGLTGVPQVSVPGAKVDGLPVGLSIVGGHGSDAALVAVAKGAGGRR